MNSLGSEGKTPQKAQKKVPAKEMGKAFGKKIARRFITSPWNSEIMEFRFGVWRGISPLYSISGRQLGEENTRPFLYNDHVPAQTIACKYEGSRFGRDINMSALRIAMAHFDEALDVTAAVTAYHRQKRAHSQNADPIGIWDLYIISRTSIALIAYKIRQGEDRISNPQVSDVLASQYQFISGIFMICRHMMNNNRPEIFQNTPISAEDLYAYADENEIFTSFNGMVCAGSAAKIMQFLNFCVDHLASQNSDGQKDETQTLSNIVDDRTKWYRYALLTIELDCFLEMTHLRLKKTTNTGLSKIDKSIFGIYQNLANYCSAILGLPLIDVAQPYEEGALNRQNEILKLLGRPPIAKISRKYLDERLNY